MDAQAFSEWLAPYPVSGRIRVLALIYSKLTVNSRELFLPDRTVGKEQPLAHWLVAYARDETKAAPLDVLSQQLLEIENRYRLEGYLTAAIESVRKSQPSKT
jgi:hypothetical protein